MFILSAAQSPERIIIIMIRFAATLWFAKSPMMVFCILPILGGAMDESDDGAGPAKVV
jgi:hypothetical protein